ncbi:universal stress protein [Phenylobacterium sp.]|uniref:universal stress protein n=1 Tax=Phenylobacterium sp. TaxID=1871053 RepID=UPI00301D3A93
MPFRDILLTALTYPDATPDRALRSGVALARRLGGDLTLLVPRIDIPQVGNPLARALMDFDRIASLEEARSAATAHLEATCAAIAAEESGVAFRTEALSVTLYEEADAICRVARTHDLALTPIGPEVAADRSLAEALLFGSGRPVLVYPETAEVAPADGFRHVAIAWDGSARAARATADALPALARAARVTIFAALGEKAEVAAGAAAPLVRHLARHGIDAVVDERGGEGRPIGRRLGDFVADAAPDLLVMGGFGHARLRQFVLGGATAAILEAPPCPVLMSH